MLMITRVISYKPAKPKEAPRKLPAREFRKLHGLCLQCGGERPCGKCGAKTTQWRERQTAEWHAAERKRKRW